MKKLLYKIHTKYKKGFTLLRVVCSVLQYLQESYQRMPVAGKYTERIRPDCDGYTEQALHHDFPDRWFCDEAAQPEACGGYPPALFLDHCVQYNCPGHR